MAEIRDDLLRESRPELVEVLRGEIDAAGRITFARFMEIALSHPEHGYYTSQPARPGFAGDFLTAPETHPIFGQALARQVAECWDLLGKPEPFVVREEGAGAGTLALDILSGLRDERPDALAATRYEVSDVNPQRVDEALARLAAAGFASNAARTDGGPLVGMLLANELLDAFPVHRLTYAGGEFVEQYVVWRAGWFAEEPGPLSSDGLADHLRDLELRDGQRLEVSPAAQAWARGLGTTLQRGFAILIDYGYPAAELYDPNQRYDGTLRTYSEHEVGTDPFRRVGMQDLTAHVDFTAIASAAEAGGCTHLGLTTQAYFFAGLGIDELLMRIQQTATTADEYLIARDMVMRLLEPSGLGRFRVLALGKDVGAPALRGMSFVLR